MSPPDHIVCWEGVIHLLNSDAWRGFFWIRWVTRLQELMVKNFRGYIRANQNKYDHKYRHTIRIQSCSYLGSFVEYAMLMGEMGNQ